MQTSQKEGTTHARKKRQPPNFSEPHFLNRVSVSVDYQLQAYSVHGLITWDKSRPGNRHPVGIDTHLMQKLYVVLL
jgi:hypothetical protein